jgi:hypothetical protein
VIGLSDHIPIKRTLILIKQTLPRGGYSIRVRGAIARTA